MTTSVLSRQVLMLNKNWVLFGTTDVERSIHLMVRESARALCTVTYVPRTWEEWVDHAGDMSDDYDYIKTPSISIPAPKVIIMTKYDECLNQKVKFSAKAIYQRDNFTCQYCRKVHKADDLSIDHVIPKSRNGKNSWENCVTACFKCNNKKSNRTPIEAGLALMKRPTRPKWNPVFHIRPDLRPEAWNTFLKDGW